MPRAREREPSLPSVDRDMAESSSLVVDASAVVDGTGLNSAACLPPDDDKTYEIGPGCLLTTVFLSNTEKLRREGGQSHSSSPPGAGTREGGEEEEEQEEEEDEANQEEASALRALGLPVSFGTSKTYKGRKRSSGAGSPSPSSSVEASRAKATPSSPSPAPSPSKYNKDIICMHYKTPKGCTRGEKCPFAHGIADRWEAQKEKKKKAAAMAAGEAPPKNYRAVRRPAGSDPSAYRRPYTGRPYRDTNLGKYFKNRGWLWTHEIYERGIKMDDDMWFSVTPFELAKHHARRLLALESSETKSSSISVSSRSGSRRGPGRLVLDGFAGVGGDAAALAFAGARVVAVDLSLPRLEAARHNAGLFFVDGSPPSSSISSSDVCGEQKEGEDEKEEELQQRGKEPGGGEKKGEHIQQHQEGLFDIVTGDFFSVAPRMRVDCVFMSPPWGGPGYSGGTKSDSGESFFRVTDDIGGLGVGVSALLVAAASALAPAAPLDVAIFLPRSTFLPDLVEAATKLGVSLEVERAVAAGRETVIGVTAYFGASARRKSSS